MSKLDLGLKQKNHGRCTPVTHLSMVYEGEMAKNQPVGLVLQLQDEVYHCCLDHLVPSHLSLPPHHLLYHQQSAPSLPNKRCCWWFTCKKRKTKKISFFVSYISDFRTIVIVATIQCPLPTRKTDFKLNLKNNPLICYCSRKTRACNQ